MSRTSTTRTLALVVAPLLIAGELSAQRDARQSLDMLVPNAPSPVKVGGRLQLSYELHLTNFSRGPLTLTRVQVVDAGSDAVLGTFEGGALAAQLGFAGRRAGETGRMAIEPGARAVVYLDLSFEHPSQVDSVRHRIVLRADEDGGSAGHTVEGGETAVDRAPILELGPPLRGGPWVAVYDLGMDMGHRRVVYAVDGRARIPGRFAIDWFRVDAEGRVARGDGDLVANALGYGAEVLAVADGVVAATRDGFEEPASIAAAPEVSIGDATGNYVALDLGGGRYAFYEHLRPGIRVRPGDRVRRGEVIAAVGFTGQTMGPHLHFHVADANAPLAAEGQPFHISDFRVIGAYPSIHAFARGEAWRGLPAGAGGGPALPGPNVVVEFPR